MDMVLFRNRFRQGMEPETLAAYEAEAEKMTALSEKSPGFISRKTYVAEDGERMVVVLFENPEATAAWRNHPEHRKAQALGRELFYEEYAVLAGPVSRAYEWKREPPAAVQTG